MQPAADLPTSRPYRAHVFTEEELNSESVCSGNPHLTSLPRIRTYLSASHQLPRMLRGVGRDAFILFYRNRVPTREIPGTYMELCANSQ